MSGAAAFRCDSANGFPAFALKCWPAQTSLDRVRQIHEHVTSLANELAFIPSYQTQRDGKTWFVDSAGRAWEVSKWMPGQPLSANASREQITIGAIALSAVHRQMSRLECANRPSSAIQDRLSRFQSISAPLSKCLDSNLSGPVPNRTGTDPEQVLQAIRSACQLLRRCWQNRSRLLSSQLAQFQTCYVPQHWILRDVHREHVLFEQGRVSGIIDFDAMRFDTPLVDFARWLGGFDSFWEAPESVTSEIMAEASASQPFLQSPISSPLLDHTGEPIRTTTDTEFGIVDSQSAAIPGVRAPEPNVGSPAGLQALQTADSIKLVVMIARATLWLSLGNWVVWLLDESRQFPDLGRVAERIGRLTDYASCDAEH
ncbi:aminoglycoside phosphotransferase family protein [Stieleria sp. JC731]|nr:phosphotransferase [Stieleria sp. JC731]MCC9600692.1 aminoglycoside phosphotransferase family protein [Stieleria sp. JC731]